MGCGDASAGRSSVGTPLDDTIALQSAEPGPMKPFSAYVFVPQVPERMFQTFT